jgi:hypothetical protein
MIRSLKTYPLLRGFRGAPPGDVAALEEGLLRVSAMVEAIPQIAEIDCNHLSCMKRAVILTRVRVAPSSAAQRCAPLPLNTSNTTR